MYTWISALAFGLPCIPLSAAHLQPHLLFSAKANAAQQVPTNTSMALGLGSFTLNATRDTLCIHASWTGLSSALTGIHIHDGAAGTNGPVIIDLMDFVQGDQLTTMLTGAAITPAIVAKHVRGELYLNIHTTDNPNGEIRGQILPETDYAYVADLNGMQQVPVVTTDGYGLGTFALAHHRTVLKFNAVFTGLTGPITAIHFHSGALGSSGPVVQDLEAFLVGNQLNGMVDPTPFLADLLAGNIYLNVHTAANPNGEIRGQVMAVHGVPFDATLNGMQQVPMVTTTARGAASLVATADLDSLWYDVVVTGLSGAMQAAHLHAGAINTTGGVVIDIADNIMGDRIQGWVTGADLADNLVEMLEGNLYLNVHTTLNPDGEIRGQVYRYMREGYTMAPDGSQQVPVAATSAVGAGIVSIDRDQSNAHIMFVVTTDMVQDLHFHKAIAGANGAVIFPMGDLIANNGVFTYWKNTDPMPFTTASSVAFRNDSIYLNVHTMDFPNGEIRGQVRRGVTCSDMGTGLVDRELPQALAAWPVPVGEQLNITLPDALPNNTTVQVVDALGNVVRTSTIGDRSERLTLDVAALPAGLYFVRMNNAGTNYSTRFVKD
ncbi:MAG: CHRD domain-containing protein [Flavobacteriales bacterium]|nr:CHRD domain-containing protein [Flavobacteriales bacterium]